MHQATTEERSTSASADSAATHPDVAEVCAGAYLADRDLSGLDLSNRDLRGADLTGADLSRCRLFGTDLSDATLVGATLKGAQLLGANLSGADLTNADCSKAVFGRAKLKDAILFQTRLRNATFAHADLRNADLRTADLRNARLREADLSHADLTRARMTKTDLTRAHVDAAIMRDADLRRTRLKGLTGYATADWIGTDVLDADFAGAYMVNRTIGDQNYLYEFRNKNAVNAIVYRIWSVTSDCGRSFGRWATLTSAIAVLFAVAYSFLNVDYGNHETFLSPLYYSTVTMTTLGYGDALPTDATAQAVAMTQVIIGHVMLGGMLSIFATKMGRRSA